MWLISLAFADPSVTVDADNAIHGEVRVVASPERVRSQLSDPRWISQVDGSGTQIVPLDPKDGCGVYDHTSPNAFKTVRYVVTWCPTETGWRSDLVSSDSFDAYAARWTVVPDGEGSRLEYRISMHTNMLVPQFVINQTTKKAVGNMLAKVQAALGTP